jgi:hypothetical protein
MRHLLIKRSLIRLPGLIASSRLTRANSSHVTADVFQLQERGLFCDNLAEVE